MRKVFCIFFLILVLLPMSALAEEPVLSLEKIYTGMSVEELRETDEILHRILNEKIIAGATLELSADEARLAAGKTLKLSVTCSGREINNKTKITYETSDKAVATAANGIITAKSAGEARITVSAAFEDGGVLTAACNVTVYVPVSVLSASSQPVTVLSGYTAELAPMVKIQPANATETGLLFSSADETVATVDTNGVVTGRSGGKTKITVTSAENTEKPKTTVINVTVTEPAGSIKTDITSLTIKKGGSNRIVATVLPDTATNKSVTWSSSDTAIARVTDNGTVTGVKAGSATLTCTAKDGSGVTAQVTVTVFTPVSRLTVSPDKVTVTRGQSKTLTAKAAPDDASDKTVKWSSDNSFIASVDQNGKVTGKSAGKARITATSKDGSGVKTSVTVYVEPQNPVTVTQIHWQTTWGMINGKMGVVGENNCVNHTIKSFDYTVKCYLSNGQTVTNYMSYSGSAFGPGREGRSRLSDTSVSGFKSAYLVEITPTYVYFTDGSSMAIPVDYQYTSTFDLR